MYRMLTNESVRLAESFPALGLCRGEKGVVRSACHYPNVAYEVEFSVGRQLMRILLMENQVTPEQPAKRLTTAG